MSGQRCGEQCQAGSAREESGEDQYSFALFHGGGWACSMFVEDDDGGGGGGHC